MNHKEKLGKQQINEVAGGVIIFKALDNGNFVVIGRGNHNYNIVKRAFRRTYDKKIISDKKNVFPDKEGRYQVEKVFSCEVNAENVKTLLKTCKENSIEFSFSE